MEPGERNRSVGYVADTSLRETGAGNLDEEHTHATVEKVRTREGRGLIPALLLALLLVSASACTDATNPDRTGAGTSEKTEALLDPPPVIETKNRNLELSHESGLRLSYPASNGEITPMFLWDGTWTTEDGRVIEIGGEEHRTPYECWGEPPKENHGVAELRCTENTMTRIAYRDGYDEAARRLDDALTKLGRDSVLWGVYCHIGGYAAAAGAVLGGAEPRELMREKQSFCDYSVLHGVGSAVVSLHPEDPVKALTETCDPDPRSSIPEFSYGSQCWHGGGFGLARQNRLDEETASRYCMQAPHPGFVANCIEGVFSFVRYHIGRAENWPTKPINANRCRNTPKELLVNPDYMTVCYRAVAEKNSSATEEVRIESLRELAAFCPQLEGEAELSGCWAGVGNAASLSVLNNPGDTEAARRALESCSGGGAHKVECEIRAMIGMVKNPQRTRGIEAEELIALSSEENRTEISERLLGWLDSIGGRSQ